MAFLPWRPLRTSPDVGAGFVDAFFTLTKTVDAESAPVFRFSQQVCGGSNRNGCLFARHGPAVQQAVHAVRTQQRARPRTAEARRYNDSIQAVAGRVEVLPPARHRVRKTAPLPAAAVGNGRRRRPASAPVLRAMEPIKAKGRPAIPPPSFKPFRAFSKSQKYL